MEMSESKAMVSEVVKRKGRTLCQPGLTTGRLAKHACTCGTDHNCLSVGEDGCDSKAACKRGKHEQG